MLPTYADTFPDETQDRPCETCRTITPTWALVEIENVWVCGQCVVHANRELEERLIYPDQDWRSTRGEWMKAERVRLLDSWRWTIMPDSPLSASCQAEFKAYLQSLHRMTIDAPDATAWSWPDPPALAYE